MVRHLCPSNIVLLWAAWAIYPVGRLRTPDAISYICMHTWLPMGTTEGTKQLVPPVMPTGIMGVHQQLSTGHKQWYIHPTLGRGGRGQEKDLQFFAMHLIYLPQLPKSVSLVHILGQPANPEVVNQRPMLGYIGRSPHGYCAFTGLIKPWPIVQSCATGLGGTVLVVAMVAPVAEYHGGQIIVLPAPYTWPVVQWRCGPSKQGSFTPTKGLQTKGTTCDPVGHAYGLVCWTRQPFIQTSKLMKPHCSFAPSFPQI